MFWYIINATVNEDTSSKVIFYPASDNKAKDSNPYKVDTESEDEFNESVAGKTEKQESTTLPISAAATMAYSSDDEIKASIQSDKSLFGSINSIDKTQSKSELTEDKQVTAQTVALNDDSDATDVDDNVNFSSPLFSTATVPQGNKNDSQKPENSSVSNTGDINVVVGNSKNQTTTSDVKSKSKVSTVADNRQINDHEDGGQEKIANFGLKRKKSSEENDDDDDIPCGKSDTDENLNYATVDEESPDIALENCSTNKVNDAIDMVKVDETTIKKKNKRQKATVSNVQKAAPVVASPRGRSRRQQKSESSGKDSSSTIYASSTESEDKTGKIKVMFTGVIDEEGEKVSLQETYMDSTILLITTGY